MPKIAYISKRFSTSSLEKISIAQRICNEYAAMGHSLTLRQLYYQFVARGFIPNRQTEYDNLGSLINDARLAGYIDWHHLEDRTRNLRSLAHWGDPAEIVDAAASSYRVDKWERQPNYVEVWIEKDALVGVLDGVCRENDVPYFSCRGYTSQSEVWRAGQRLMQSGQPVTIIHLGDHDPSGIDMTRDIEDRLRLFTEDAGIELTVNRIALNANQIDRYAPPPNPAKMSDSRASSYVAQYGNQSWELDALAPDVIEREIQDAIDDLKDPDIWEEDEEREERGRERIKEMARSFRDELEA